VQNEQLWMVDCFGCAIPVPERTAHRYRHIYEMGHLFWVPIMLSSHIAPPCYIALVHRAVVHQA
jgi:hypothetical protein